MLRVAAHANLPVRAAVVRRLRADTLLAGKAPRLLASEVQLRGSAVRWPAPAPSMSGGRNPLHLVVQLNHNGCDLKRRQPRRFLQRQAHRNTGGNVGRATALEPTWCGLRHATVTVSYGVFLRFFLLLIVLCEFSHSTDTAK
jgi:hypothetical protein